MLNKFRFLVKKGINILGYDILNKNLRNNSDDPFFIFPKLLSSTKVKCIIDGGASIGVTSRQLSDSFSNAFIHAIEPYPNFYKCIEDIAATNNKIIPHNFALSNIDGQAKLKVNVSEGTNSLLKTTNNSKQIYGNLLENKSEINVQTKTIDSFVKEQNITSIDILKLDLQGFEEKALDGAVQSLKRKKIDIILCELLFEDLYNNQTIPFKIIQNLTENFSFTLFNLYQKQYHHGKIVQADALLIRCDILKDLDSMIVKNFHPYSKLMY